MARSDGAKQSDTNKQAKRTTPQTRADDAEKPAADEAKLRSDWEGMAPKPDQTSDDVAAPGALPSKDHADN